MLQFRDYGYWQFFSDYGFKDQTSSGHNRLNHAVHVDDADADAGVRLWDESAQSSSSWVSTSANNRADSCS